MKESQSPAPQLSPIMPPNPILGPTPRTQPKTTIKAGAKTNAKTNPKTMAKTMAQNIAIVATESAAGMPSSGEDGTAVTATVSQHAAQSGAEPSGADRSVSATRAHKTAKSKSPMPPVSFRQVWAAQQQKKHLQIQVEQFNQQYTPPSLNPGGLEDGAGRSPQPAIPSKPAVASKSTVSATPSTSPEPYADPWSAPDARAGAPSAAPSIPAPMASEDAMAAWENAQALRTLSGRQAARTQIASPMAGTVAFAPGGAPSPSSPPSSPGRMRRRRPRTLKSWLRAALRGGIGLLHQGTQRLHRTLSGQSQLQPGQGQNNHQNNQWWDAALWVGGAALVRWGSQLLLVAMPGFAPILAGGMVLSTIAVMYWAWQSQNGSAILYRLFLLLLGFWLGGRF